MATYALVLLVDSPLPSSEYGSGAFVLHLGVLGPRVVPPWLRLESVSAAGDSTEGWGSDWHGDREKSAEPC